MRPGHYLTFDATQFVVVERKYWSLNSSHKKFDGSYEEALKALEDLLHDTVSRQMISDVPLGAFLSGGIDSSLVVSLMQSQSSMPVKTFTIGFNEKKYNEADYARDIAKYLKSEHTELYVSPKEVLKIIPILPSVYDEPFSDSSQIATLMVAQLTKRHVTVSLSGDAGDELFGGYNRYILAPKLLKKLRVYPKWVRSALARSLKVTPAPFLESAFNISNDRHQKLLSILEINDSTQLYENLITHWGKGSQIMQEDDFLKYKLDYDSYHSFEESMMSVDSTTYLPDDILVKVDRAAMFHSLETRIPFLNHKIVEFAHGLPLSYKINNGEGKRILKDILYKHVPKSYFERPKMGFAVPIDYWLKNDLRDWAENLLDKQKLKEQGFVNCDTVHTRWREHLSGRKKWHYHLWDVLMFQAWFEENF